MALHGKNVKRKSRKVIIIHSIKFKTPLSQQNDKNLVLKVLSSGKLRLNSLCRMLKSSSRGLRLIAVLINKQAVFVFPSPLGSTPHLNTANIQQPLFTYVHILVEALKGTRMTSLVGSWTQRALLSLPLRWDCRRGASLLFLAVKAKLIVILAAALCHSKSTLISRHRNGPAVEWRPGYQWFIPTVYCI